MTSTVLSDSDN